jgi:uncharacterized protein (TIGR02147 family)
VNLRSRSSRTDGVPEWAYLYAAHRPATRRWCTGLPRFRAPPPCAPPQAKYVPRRVKTSALGERPSVPETFRQFLQGELGRRCRDNPQYSMRAFARFLRTDHATLSQVLRGKRRATATTIRRLGARLDLAHTRVERFVEAERSGGARISGTPVDIAGVRELTSETLDAIADWHDWAILELMRVQSFVPDARWIARVLDCSLDEVQLAIHRLVRFGFLEMTGRRQWVDRTGNVLQTSDQFARVAVERLAAQLHQLSLRVARASGSHRWTQTATTIAVSAATVPAVIARLAQVRAEIVTLLEREPARDAVYHLAISFIPITESDDAPTKGGRNDGITGASVADRDEGP